MNFDARTWYVNDYDFDDITVIDDVSDMTDDKKIDVGFLTGMFNISWLTPKNIGIALLILIELVVLGALVFFGIDNFIM